MRKHRNPPPKHPERRRFLRGLAAFGGMVGITQIIGGGYGGVSEASESDAIGSTHQGYQETAHIRTYYEKARL